MAAQGTLFHPRRFTRVDELRVLMVEDNQVTNKWRVETVDPVPGGYITVGWRESWLIYQSYDGLDDLQASGLFPSWMVVSADATI